MNLFGPWLLLIGCAVVHSLVQEGAIVIENDQWEIIGKFCFGTSGGTLTIDLEAHPELSNQMLLFYHDSSDIPAIYDSENSCQYKAFYASDELHIMVDRNIEYTVHGGRPRFWYIAAANCDAERIEIPAFNMTMTNEGGTHVSYEELGLELFGCFTLLGYAFGLFVMYFCMYLPTSQQKNGTHVAPVYSVLMMGMVFDVIALSIEVVDRLKYSQDGLHNEGLKQAALIGQLIPQCFLVYLFVALSKGWQVNSREVPERQTVIEVTLLFLGANLCMYWYEFLNPPPIVSSEYLFDSGAGLLIIAIRVTMFVWFVGSAKQTRDNTHSVTKRSFFVLLCFVAAVWFLSAPGIVLASIALKEWNRMKVVTVFSWVLDFVFYWVIAFMFRCQGAFIKRDGDEGSFAAHEDEPDNDEEFE